MDQSITFVCISDTHGYYIQLPKGDVLIHCGDFSDVGLEDEILSFIDWLKDQPFKHKIVIAGNHDIGLDIEHYETDLKQQFHRDEEVNPEKLLKELKANCTYLENSSTIVEGYKIWGSPYSLEFYDWAFQLKKENAKIFWQQIEADSDIIVTHGPPLNHGDAVYFDRNSKMNVGDEELLKRILEIKPKYHLFGHIHEGYGLTQEDGIQFMNCSILNQQYKVKNQPFVFTLPKKL